MWYLYLQNWVIYGVNVGKYSSTMEHMGYISLYIFIYLYQITIFAVKICKNPRNIVFPFIIDAP